MIRILLAEDQGMVRGALGALLSLEADMEIVAETGRADEIVTLATQTRPDVALLDIEMPGGDGLTAASTLHNDLPNCKIIILTTFGKPGYLRRAIEGGVMGFLMKDAPAAQLAIAIRRVMAGQRMIDPELAMTAFAEGPNPFTDREHAVLSAASTGASVAQIARELRISEGTVRNHLSSIIQKMNAHNRSEAVYLAKEKGWL